MIRTECYGGGHRWTCLNCDWYENEYGTVMRQYTNSSTPPAECPKCADRRSSAGHGGDIGKDRVKTILAYSGKRPASVGYPRWQAIVKHIKREEIG